MNRIFADSFYFFALLNPRDAFHERAVQFSSLVRRGAMQFLRAATLTSLSALPPTI